VLTAGPGRPLAATNAHVVEGRRSVSVVRPLYHRGRLVRDEEWYAEEAAAVIGEISRRLDAVLKPEGEPPPRLTHQADD
jgi:hypothetical protein